MNLLFILITGVVVYFLIKGTLFLLRPFLIAKLFKEIDQLYQKTQTIFAKDLEQTIKDLDQWHASNRTLRINSSKEDLETRLQNAQTVDKHEKEVYEKFIRLKEHFIQNPPKLAEAILIYKRYLGIRLKQNENAIVLSQALTSGVVSFNEFESSARKTIIILEELESKMDVLLNQ